MVLQNLFARQQWRNRHRKQTYGHGEGEGEDEMYGESNMETYITISKIDSQQEFTVCLRKLKQGLCINLEGWDAEGDVKVQEGIYVHLWLIHLEVWQKTEEFCKAIILQFKNKWIKKEKKIKQPIKKMGGRPTHKFFQRRNTDDQQMHEKMLNITHY